MIHTFFFFRYSEVCRPGYSFGGSSTGATGHFTQVVWKESTELGIGKATTKKNGMLCTYVVGRYRPAGNFIGNYKPNVPKGEFNKGLCSKLDNMIKRLAVKKEKKLVQKITKWTKVDKPRRPIVSMYGNSQGNFPANLEDDKKQETSTPHQPNSLGFADRGLLAHNKYREKHGTPPLTLDVEMSKEAEAYAKEIAKKGTLEHSKTEDGENLAMGCTSSGTKMSAEEATRNW